MAKKGVTYPYRIRYHYPPSTRSGGKEINGTSVILTRDTLVSEARAFLERGADIKLGTRQEDGKIHWFAEMTPENMGVTVNA